MAVTSEVESVANLDTPGMMGAEVTTTQTVTLLESSLVGYIDCVNASSENRKEDSYKVICWHLHFVYGSLV